MATRANVFPSGEETFPRSLFGGPSRRSYRAAIKEIILNVKARYGLSDWDLAERIGVHKDTIENAQEEVANLDVVTLLNIAWTFGEDANEPFVGRPPDAARQRLHAGVRSPPGLVQPGPAEPVARQVLHVRTVEEHAESRRRGGRQGPREPPVETRPAELLEEHNREHDAEETAIRARQADEQSPGARRHPPQ